MKNGNEIQPTRLYYPETSVSQRKQLFRLVEAGERVEAAASKTHVSVSTYYYWQERYESAGESGLENKRSHAPKEPRIKAVSEELKREVLAYHRANPKAGCRSVANAIRKAHKYRPVIGHTKVWELVKEAKAEAKGKPEPKPQAEKWEPVVVHAPQANQTYNIDLCVVPVSHSGAEGEWHSTSWGEAAAGQDKVEQPSGEASEKAQAEPPASYPGASFADETLNYEEKMQHYAAEREQKRGSRGNRKHRRSQKQQMRAELNAQADELRLARRRLRQQRQQEDETWRQQRAEKQQAERAWQATPPKRRKLYRAQRRARQAQWQASKQQRQQQIEQRQREDATGQQQRLALASQLAQLTNTQLASAWLAILVVIDNGTRRCIALPLFTAGLNVTAQMVVDALRPCCPPELQFLISDNGSHFIAAVFADLVREQHLLHLFTSPKRPQTNGVAERMVRTLKEWLQDRSWNSPEELQERLNQFILYYNERPHQALELNGLSPNEYARRLAAPLSLTS